MVSLQDADDDPNVGEAQQDPNESNSLSGLVSTLAPVLIVAVIMTAIFLILRRSQERQYAPRSYLGSLRAEERSPPLPTTLFGWIPAINKVCECYLSVIAKMLRCHHQDTRYPRLTAQLPRRLFSPPIPENYNRNMFCWLLHHVAGALPCPHHRRRWQTATRYAHFRSVLQLLSYSGSSDQLN